MFGREAETMQQEKRKRVMEEGRLAPQLQLHLACKGLPKGLNIQQVSPTVHTENGTSATEAFSPSR